MGKWFNELTEGNDTLVVIPILINRMRLYRSGE